MKNEREALGRLVRDMRAPAWSDANRLPASERLSAELGRDLLAVILAELNRGEAGALSLCSRPRRVA